MNRHKWLADGSCTHGCGWRREVLGRGMIRYARDEKWMTVSPRRGRVPQCQPAQVHP